MTHLRSHAAAALSLILLVVLFCAAVAWPRPLVLGAGPRLDGAAEGFHPWAMRDDRRIYRLTGERSSVRLPLVLVGPVNVGMTLRSPAGPCTVQMSLGDESLGRVPVKGSEVHAAFLSRGSVRSLELRLEVLGTRRAHPQVAVRELLISPEGGVVLPAPMVVLALAAALCLTWLLFLAHGVTPRSSAILVAAGLGAPACVLAMLDPHAAVVLVLRLSWWLPLLGALVALTLRTLARHLAALELDERTRATGMVMVLLALVVRGGFLLHPGHYYKDVPIHNQITTLGVRRGIADIWRNVEQYQLRYDLGTTYVPTGLRVIRYPVGFYTLAAGPAALEEALSGRLDVDYWNRIVAATAAALQVLPTFLILLALRHGRSAAIAGTLLAIFSPLDIHELINVSYPATLGKLANLTLACYLILAARHAGSWRWTSTVCVVLIGCLLTYPAAWVELGVCLAFYLALFVAGRELRTALRLLIAGVGAVAAAQVAFYGDLVVRLLTFHAPASFALDSPAKHFAELLSPGLWVWGPVLKWFTAFHVVAMVAGLVVAMRSTIPRAAKGFLLAWFLAMPTLLALYRAAGVILLYLRPLYFTSTLFAILGALGLAWLKESGIRGARTLAVLGFAVLLWSQFARLSDFASGFYQSYRGTVPPFSLLKHW